MPLDFATDPRLRRFCRDNGLSPSAARALAGLVEELVAESGGHTRLTTGVLDALGADPEPSGPVEDRYEDLGRIGAGATGDVRRVRDRWMARTLARKILHKALLAHPGAIARFRREAALTASLDHPGIVVVHDQGTLPDGRPWFTMPEVQGRTFAAVLDSGEWTLHRRIDAFARACQAVAHAHSRGVLHRDVKPRNIMIGAFGVVLVMDWGLACRVEEAEAGTVLGTPGFIAPEIGSARGSPAADVYALGATLFQILTGRPPPSAWGSPEPVRPSSGDAGPARPKDEDLGEALADTPPDLADLCLRALATDPANRPSAPALADEALAWLDGARRREQATTLVERTVERLPALAAVQERGAVATEAFERARRSVEERRTSWIHEQEAAALSRQAALAEAEVERELHAALNLDPASEQAHLRLADLYRDRMARAEARHDADAVAINEVLLRAHDRGRHAAWLRGDATVSLRTSPPGARVTLHPWIERDRRLIPGPGRVLGETPLRDAPVTHGSHLLVVEADGYAPMRLPFVVERLGRWDAEVPIPLLPAGDPALCYVPAGWFPCGGDPDAADGLPARRIWVDGFVMRRFPVTQGEWLAFVREEAAAGREVESLLPRTKNDLRPIYRLGSEGWEAGPDDKGEIWTDDLPITQITWLAARRYCASRPPLFGERWRLPDEVEWEKAARGVDGRVWPWGWSLDPTEINNVMAPGTPGRASVRAFPDDESLYGIRGLAGNVRDLCSNAWMPDGDLPAERLAPREADGVARVVARGGNWHSAVSFCRPATRFVWRPDAPNTGVGFRMVASLRGVGR